MWPLSARAGKGGPTRGALFAEDAAQVMAVCDVAEVTDLEPFYYKGKGGRKTVIAEAEKHYQEKNKDYKCAEYEDSATCSIRKSDRRHTLRDARSQSRPRLDHRDEDGQARVLRETADAQRVGGARGGEGCQGNGRGHPDGNHGHSSEGIRQTCEWIWDGAIGAVHEVSAWSDAGGWTTGKGRPKETPRCRADSIGTSGWARAKERSYNPA